MRMITILVLDFFVVYNVIYMIFLITKNGPGSANYIILLLRLNEKYRDANNNSLSDPTLGDLFCSVSISTSPRHLLLSHQWHCLLCLLLLHLLSRWVMCLLCSPNHRRRLFLLVLHRAAPPTSCATTARAWDMSWRIAQVVVQSLLQRMEGM